MISVIVSDNDRPAGIYPATRRKSGNMSLKGIVAMAVITILIAACGTVRRSEPIAGPLQLTELSHERGRAVFVEHCHRCHPGGESGLGFALNDKPLPDFMIRFQVRNGLGAMPAFPVLEISGAEMNDLLAYIRALRQHANR